MSGLSLLRILLPVLVLSATFVPALAAADCEGVSAVVPSDLKSLVVATGLVDPLLVTAPPGDTDRLFFVEQPGRIRVLQRGAAPTGYTTFLDITAIVTSAGNEQGLLGLAFDPDYASNGRFYVNYTRSGTGMTFVSRFTVSAGDPNLADAASEAVLIAFSQPQSNHNGGHLQFGTDGMLYIGTGDGGGANDAHGQCGNSQNTGNLLGKLLRIDPNGAGGGDCGAGAGAPFGIPAGNPFADGPGGDCDEIWAYGLRNPWRFDIDPANGDLYIADVGQNCWEEINWVPGSSSGGENYGWRPMEGSSCFNIADAFNCTPLPESCLGSPACNAPSLTLPFISYDHAGPFPSSCSVTGGPVYRGCRMPTLHGNYFWGDYCSGIVRSTEVVAGVPTNVQDWTDSLDPSNALWFGLTSFGSDAQGELYIVDRDGIISKVSPMFADYEVSGIGAAERFRLNRDGNWSWEDLEYATMHPVDFYRVYRGVPAGTFECIHSTNDTGWFAGDTALPAPGELIAYLVTAVAPDGRETGSGTPPRTLSNPCPAP